MASSVFETGALDVKHCPAKTDKGLIHFELWIEWPMGLLKEVLR